MRDKRPMTTPQPEVREDSPIFANSNLKEAVVLAVLKREITTEEAAELFVEYGLRSA